MSSEELARFVSSTRYADLPANVVHQAKRCILDFVGLAAGSAAAPDILAMQAALGVLGGPPQATQIGSGRRASLTDTALLIGMAAHLEDFDDSFLPALHHPSSPILCCAFPLAEWKQASGRDLLLAHVLGFETSARVGLAICASPAAPFWFPTAVLGAVSSAAAAATLLKLDSAATVAALGGGAGMAAGIREHHGSAWKSIQVGRAGANGVLAGLLASQGIKGSPVPFEGNRGFLKAFGEPANEAALTEGLGQKWHVLQDSFKPYACGVVAHPIIDAMRNLKAGGLAPDDVASVRLRVHPYVLAATGKLEPRTGLEGKFSTTFCAAIGLIYGAAGPSQFTDDVVLDPVCVALRRRINLEEDNALGRHETIAEVRTVKGATLREHVTQASGTEEKPLTDADLSAKFLNLTTPSLGGDGAHKLEDLVWRLDKVEQIAELISATVPERH